MSTLLRQHLFSTRLYWVFAAHVVVFAAAYALAYWLRFDFAPPAAHRALFFSTAGWVLLVKSCVFYGAGGFQGWWRYVTLADLAVVLRAATLCTLAIVGVDYLIATGYRIPRSVLLLDWGGTILLLGGLRSCCRLAREHVWPALGVDKRRPALLIGADLGGEALARQILQYPGMTYRIVGFLDPNCANHGSRLGGIPFLGAPAQVVRLAQRTKARDVLVIANSIGGPQLRTLIAECRQANIRLKMIPALDELLNTSSPQVRDVDIHDLLRRDPVDLDSEAISKLLRGRRVMVTGAGGSIGSEICREILRRQPERLVLVERAENNLFQIEQELLRASPRSPLFACVADVHDAPRMQALFQRYRPQIVFHAAAHKHVPLMESNPGEAVKNNVFGTKVLADLARRHAVERFVLISTDKAVNPTSIMGITKQLAERYLRAISVDSTTRFIAVRFGNVLASNGSVVPIFQEQIRRGGPITITHPDMQRYFMTIPEASQLVLQAATMGVGGDVFVLDMGEPVRILDLAHDLIRLSGHSPDQIQITIVGARPGEKLSEELCRDDEQTQPTTHAKLRVAYPPVGQPSELLGLFAELESLVHAPDELLRCRLQQIAAASGTTRCSACPQAPLLAPAEVLHASPSGLGDDLLQLWG
jgi:FlaA1/EpsC-like NDP-sugar epimerase